MDCSSAGDFSWDETQAKRVSEGLWDLFGNISYLTEKGNLSLNGEEA